MKVCAISLRQPVFYHIVLPIYAVEMDSWIIPVPKNCAHSG